MRRTAGNNPTPKEKAALAIDPTTLGLTGVILAAGEQQKSLLTNESFWSSVATWGMWIIRALTVLGSIGTDGMVVGVIKLIEHRPGNLRLEP